MSLVVRTASIQARVTPAVKEASERVLRRIGLTMSEAVELFLRRVIIDEKLPFEVVALRPDMLLKKLEELGAKEAAETQVRKLAGSRKRNSETFLRSY